MREAKKANLDKNADIKQQMDLAGQTVLVRAYVTDWIKKNPIPEAELRKEYDAIKSQMGDKEYKVKHILVEKEDEAKEVIAQLQKGGKFDDLAKARSKDPGSQGPRRRPRLERARRLREAVRRRDDRNAEGQVHAAAGADAVRLARDPGRGRRAKRRCPAFDEVKPQLQQRMQAAHLDKYFKELRAKGGV